MTGEKWWNNIKSNFILIKNIVIKELWYIDSGSQNPLPMQG